MNAYQVETLKRFNVVVKGEGEYIRNCPRCNDQLVYSSFTGVVHACKARQFCTTCKYLDQHKMGEMQKEADGFWSRKCPTCVRRILHRDRKYCGSAILHKTPCKSCTSTIIKSLPKGVWVDFSVGLFGKNHCMNCPKCNKIIYESRSVIVNRYKRKSVCGTCSQRVGNVYTKAQRKVISGKVSTHAKNRWANPEFKARMSPIFSKAAYKRWANPEYRAKMMAPHLTPGND
jgi:hypothetical protein